jgi:hypothetical protein
MCQLAFDTVSLASAAINTKSPRLMAETWNLALLAQKPPPLNRELKRMQTSNQNLKLLQTKQDHSNGSEV